MMFTWIDALWSEDCGEQYSHGDICSSKISASLNLNDYLLRVKSETPPLPTLSPLILSLGKKLPPNDVKISINFFTFDGHHYHQCDFIKYKGRNEIKLS